MHETGLIKNLLKQVEVQVNPEAVTKVTMQVSKIGGISSGHLRHHFEEYVQGEDSRWKNTELEIKEVEYGKDVDLISVAFKQKE